MVWRRLLGKSYQLGVEGEEEEGEQRGPEGW